MLLKLRHELPLDTKKRIYKALVESHLNYMSPVWGSANYSAIQALQILQNRTLRNVYNLDRLTNRSEMYCNKVDNNLTVRGLFFVNVAAFMYNTLHNKILTNFKFERNQSERTDDYIRPEHSRTANSAKRISAIGPRIFNSVPVDIQQSKNVSTLKFKIKELVKQDAFMRSCFNGDFLAKYT